MVRVLSRGPDLRQMVEAEPPINFYRRVCGLLNEKKLAPEDIDYRELAEACGVLGNLRGLGEGLHSGTAERLLGESGGSSVNSGLFAVTAGELIARVMIATFENDDDWIGHKLVEEVGGGGVRGGRLAGFTALGEALDVQEGADYEATTFEEKYVTSKEAKKGRILEVTEELLSFGARGEINRRARALAYYVRQTKERTIVRGVIDADGIATGAYVYRPSGTGELLYATNGSNKNWIGVGGTAPYNAAVPLNDHTDIDHAFKYRATQITDDRVDGTPRPITSRPKQVLVAEALRSTARSIVNTTEVETTVGGVTRKERNPHSDLEVLSSPFIDEAGGEHANDWYLGNFRKQFVWVDLWPFQTFLQRGQDTARGFDADVVLRVKCRYYGGVSATATEHVTKIDGA